MIRKLHIYPYFKKSKHAITKFPKGIQYDYSCPLAKDNTTQHAAEYHRIPPNTTQHTAEYHRIPPNTTQHTAEYHRIPPNTTQHTAEYHRIPPNTTQHTAEYHRIPPNTTQHTAEYHRIPPNTTQHTAEYHPIPPNTTQHTAEQRIRYQLPTEPRREEYDRNESQPVAKMDCCVRWPFKSLNGTQLMMLILTTSQIFQRLFPKVEPPSLMIWIQSGQVIDQLLSKPKKRLTWYLPFVNFLYIQKKTCITLIFHVLHIYWKFVKRGCCLCLEWHHARGSHMKPWRSVTKGDGRFQKPKFSVT